MALTPQRRLLNALNDPLLEPLLQQHFRRVFVAELRAFSESVNDFTEKERNLLRQAANVLKKTAVLAETEEESNG